MRMHDETTCTRVIVDAFGEVDRLRVERGLPLPVPGRGEVRICVEASSVQYTDTIIRRGRYPDAGRPPLTLGYDLVGRIDTLGPQVEGWSPGQRVADLTKLGANASHVIRPIAGLVAVPESVEPAEATALILSGVTAYQMLFRHVQVTAGQRVLIQGGSGGVGWFAVQLARAAGAEVFTTARPAQHTALEALGAEVFDYRDPNYPERIRERTQGGVDLAFDGLGADHFRPSLRALHAAGRLVTIGASDAVAHGKGMTASVLSALARNANPFGPCVSFYSITSARSRHPAHFREDLASLYQRLAAGTLRVRIERRIGFADVARAHADLEGGGVAGKIVLLPD